MKSFIFEEENLSAIICYRWFPGGLWVSIPTLQEKDSSVPSGLEESGSLVCEVL